MFKRTESDTLTYLLGLVSNTVVLIINLIFIRSLLTLIMLHYETLQMTSASALIIILTIDTVYRYKLLQWSGSIIAEEFRENICEIINGPPCSINPKFFDSHKEIKRHSGVNRVQPPIQHAVVHAIGNYLNLNVLCEPQV